MARTERESSHHIAASTASKMPDTGRTRIINPTSAPIHAPCLFNPSQKMSTNPNVASTSELNTAV